MLFDNQVCSFHLTNGLGIVGELDGSAGMNFNFISQIRRIKYEK